MLIILYFNIFNFLLYLLSLPFCTSPLVSDNFRFINTRANNPSPSPADLTARLSWINWENLGVSPTRRSVLSSLALTADAINN